MVTNLLNGQQAMVMRAMMLLFLLASQQQCLSDTKLIQATIPSSFVSLDSDDTPCITPSGTPSGGSVDSPRKRPARKRKEKEAIRKSKIQEAKDTKFCNLLEQFTESVAEKDANKAAKDALKAEKFTKKTELEERKVKAMEEMTSIERREIERKEKETEMQIMNMNLSEIDDPR
ncbi:hypothetical protein Dimus_018051 [Dionaea muscipula]